MALGSPSVEFSWNGKPVMDPSPLSASTQAAVEALKNQLKEKRQNLVLYKRPFKTLALFSVVAYEGLSNLFIEIVSHKVFVACVVPFVLLITIAHSIEGPHTGLVDLFLFVVKYIVWWCGLGILSSVGLGSGMQSGTLFLFPHVMRVTRAATACKSLEFEYASDMWFASTRNLYLCQDALDATSSPPSELPSYWSVLAMTAVPALIWGAGTAIGEIPPYAFSYAAAKAGKKNEEFDELQESVNSNDVMGRMIAWMVHFLEKWGFWGLFLMAAWPNAMFDLCGICCGHFMMPFWSFFIAVFLGKAIVKAPAQAMVITAAFYGSFFDLLMDFVEKITPHGWGLHEWGHAKLKSIEDSFHKQADDQSEEGPGLFKQLWGMFMFTAILLFMMSTVHQLAQQRQMEKDMEKVAMLEKGEGRRK